MKEYHIPNLPLLFDVESKAILKQVNNANKKLAELKVFATGRIVNVLYLVINDLLDLPILYLSRYIILNKAKYYELLQKVRDNNAWEEWILFFLKGIEEISIQTIQLIKSILNLIKEYKIKIKSLSSKIYSHELINNLFKHPYTKIEFLEDDLKVERRTAKKYLDLLVESDLLKRIKIGRSYYYLNVRLFNLLMECNLKKT